MFLSKTIVERGLLLLVTYEAKSRPFFLSTKQLFYLSVRMGCATVVDEFEVLMGLLQSCKKLYQFLQTLCSSF